jgi:2-polyprenyl-3-methyl-5-hydroxy-6-metoxy-1,4-benzoquinol methylase
VRRQRRPERMDRLDADPTNLARSLRDLRNVNRWLGGRRSAVRHVLDIASRVPAVTVQVLDVGTGAADIPIALLRTGRRRGLQLHVLGVDRHPATAAFAVATASDPELEIAQADALALPFRDAQFDVAMCNTTLHHFDAEEAMRVLAELNRVARWGVVVTDLARSRAALSGALLLASTVWLRHPITRHDGPWSVRAAFTPSEMAELAAAAGLRNAKVRPEPVFRLSVVVDRAPSDRRMRIDENPPPSEASVT